MSGFNITTRLHSSASKRLRVWLSLAVVLLGLGSGYFYFWLNRPIGNGPAGPTVPRELFAKTWSTRPVLLLGMGDSVTAGFGATKHHSYFDRLVSNPDDECSGMKGICLGDVLPKLKTGNIAISGSTSIQHLGQQIPKLETVPSNTLGIVVLTTGGNDLIHSYGQTSPREGAMFGATLGQARPWIDAFEQRLDLMIHRIEEAFPGGCHIFLANIYDPTDGVGDIQWAGLPPWKEGMAIHKAYNEIIARAAQKHGSTHLVNLHDEFLGHGIHCTQFWAKHYRRADPHYWYFVNLEDPNDRGYDAIRGLFLIAIAKVMNQGSHELPSN